LPFNFAILDWAAKTREILNKAQLPDGVSFYNIYGVSLNTPFDVWYAPLFIAPILPEAFFVDWFMRSILLNHPN